MATRQLSSGDTAGTVLGQSATDLISFYGATPIAQRSGSTQTAVVTTAITSSSPFGFASAAQGTQLVALVNEMRLVLVNSGLMAGS